MEYFIGFKLYKKDKTIENYREMAIWCNSNNAKIEDKDEYFEIVAIVIPEPTLQEQVQTLENRYQMNRWQREGILAEGSLYSQYSKDKAQEIEDLAEQLRHLTEGGNNE